ncbi:MAG TPA: lysophospholipid acyltransferase family protein [Candidatus Krumholzibacteria bacterium]|nr:lysophospholipid acyltransferase family protein [Candidatus Krumholzibacteria bacterium]
MPGRFAPERREPALRRHVRVMRRTTLAILRAVGRARFDIEPRIPGRGGILVLMNHQSLLDIPVAGEMVPDAYPRFVTHYRYAKGIPLVSHLIRMMNAIPVYPGKMGKAELDRLAEAARTSQHPIVLFPEGHRTQDGEIRPWKRGALDTFLSAREWTVHVVVIDGLWKSARLPDFVRTLTRVRCRVETAGVFEYDGRGRESHDEIVERMRAAMCDKLSQMRRAPDAVGVEPQVRTPGRPFESGGAG